MKTNIEIKSEHMLNIQTILEQPHLKRIYALSELYYDKERLSGIISELFAQTDIDLDAIINKKVLIKPNWVRHPLKPQDDLCLVTHPNFILSILEYVLGLKPSKVIIGDAPIQGCDWDKMISKEFLSSVSDLSEQYNIPIQVLDFRKIIMRKRGSEVIASGRNPDEYVLFDLGDKSYLEPITDDKALFRVTDYDPDRLAESHKPGKHVYCIAHEIFEVDLIIALPKAKTHQKTGITNALKLLVGINGDKDYLPHHRIGGTGMGGDCYPGRNYLLSASEAFLDSANRRIGKKLYKPLKYASKICYRLAKKTPEHNLAAAWHGNDTCWRMVMDINLIAKFGKADGTLSDLPQRSILYVSDGIIGGQGDGPLHPDPLALGVVMISENPALMDRALASLMGFNYTQFPLLKAAWDRFIHGEYSISINGVESNWDEVKQYSILTEPPPGWRKYLDQNDIAKP